MNNIIKNAGSQFTNNQFTISLTLMILNAAIFGCTTRTAIKILPRLRLFYRYFTEQNKTLFTNENDPEKMLFFR